VHLGVLRGASVIYLDKVEGRQPVRMYSQIGNASPVYCTGVGKAALSVLPDERVHGAAGRMSFQQFTPSTRTAERCWPRLPRSGLIRQCLRSGGA
jgi:DNA-binding IclR family transcriptional regulator